MALKQHNRLVTITTPLGEDVLGVRSIAFQEQLGRLFEIEASLRSDDADINFDDIVGHDVSLRLRTGPETERQFHGKVSRFVQTADKGGLASYEATIVPWLWLLTRTADCRIFQEKTIPEIITEVLQGHGFSDFELRLSETYLPREYCVQYRETDFNFVSRLMEQEGITYFFEHTEENHTMVLADSISAHTPFTGYEEVVFRELMRSGSDEERITDWVITKEVQPWAYALNDFDPLRPKASLRASAGVTRQHGAADFEIYDYPGEYVEQPEGTRLSDVRLTEMQCQHEVMRAESNVRGLGVGRTFTLRGHPRASQNREHLITGVSLQADAGEFASEAGRAAGGECFTCRFTAIESGQVFRTARLTPKPVVQGPQTAIVVGPDGEEIHTDEHSRVKLQFHWDRYGQADENSSCWVRVSQGWAGKHWGAIYLPRIGQEVIVEFLEGDPDRPIVTGRVYNGEAMPPYALPDNKTVSTLKSNSSKGGEGCNEIRFEDKKDSEQVLIQAQKNLDLHVKNDARELVGHNRHLDVKNDKLEHVENNRDEIVDADHKEKISGDRHLKVEGKEAKSIGGSLSLQVAGDVIEVFKAKHSEQTTRDYFLKADNIVIEGKTNITLKVGRSHIAIEAGGIGIRTGGDIQMDAGGDTISVTTGDVDIQSNGKATIYSGGEFWAASDADARVTGLNVKLEADVEAKTSATMVKVEASGPAEIKGTPVKLN